MNKNQVFNAKFILKLIRKGEVVSDLYVWTNKRTKDTLWSVLFDKKPKEYEAEWAWCRVENWWTGPGYEVVASSDEEFMQRYPEYRVDRTESEVTVVRKSYVTIRYVDGSETTNYFSNETLCEDFYQKAYKLMEKPFEIKALKEEE